MRFVIYARKSKATQKGDSVGNQVEMCQNYLTAHFPDTRPEDVRVFEDDGFSGKNTKRPGFQRMMDAFHPSPPDYLVVYRLDRISRSVGDFADILKQLERTGTQFISITEHFDTSTVMGRAMMSIASVFAQMERETISERVTDNMLMLSHTGRWLGGRTPLGFQAVRVPAAPEKGVPKAYSVLQQDRRTAEAVKEAIALYLQQGTLRGTRQALHQRQTLPNLSDFALKNLLTNPVYCLADPDAYDYFYQLGCALPDREQFDGSFGCMPYNRHNEKPGQSALRQPDQWVIAVGRHPGLVDGKTFITIQRRLNADAQKHPRNQTARNDYALLTGLLVCKRCGSKMYTQPQNSGRGKRRASGAFTYLCERRKNFGSSACDCPSVSGKNLDNAVRHTLSGYLSDGSAFAARLLSLKEEDLQRRRLDHQAQEKQSALSRLEKKMYALVDRMADPDLPPEALTYVKRQVRQLSDQISALKQEMAQLPIPDGSQAQAGYEAVCRLIDQFNQQYGGMTIPQQRDLLRQVIQRVEWDGEHADIYPIGGS